MPEPLDEQGTSLAVKAGGVFVPLEEGATLEGRKRDEGVGGVSKGVEDPRENLGA